MMEPRVTVAGKPEKEKRSTVKRMPILVGAAVVLMLAVAIGIWQFYVRRPSVQDEITRNIITEMAVTLGEGDNERLMLKKAQNVETWISYRRRIAQFRLFTEEANLKARELSEKAIDLEPEYSEAYSLLG
jgi:hypothetical protein